MFLDFYFKNKKLEDLYTKGTSKKYKLERRIIVKFLMAVKKIEVAKNIYDLQTPANNFENLEGYDSRYSIRVTRKFRLEFEIEWDDKEKGIVEIVGIEELSKHYE
ncbi:MAG: type II toxin-antitoxin system RelE/ParE family toxin [Candidatus Delongbacteria bacterium]|nr:type II toxin-antitoxin system RelE/ParE family toxin [Candidatus Delongbacteria bacterium]